MKNDSIRMPDDLSRRVDAFAAGECLQRPEAIRRLLIDGTRHVKLPAANAEPAFPGTPAQRAAWAEAAKHRSETLDVFLCGVMDSASRKVLAAAEREKNGENG